MKHCWKQWKIAIAAVAPPAWPLKHLHSAQNPTPFSQGQLNDLEHDLNLSKESSELLASRLGEHGVLDLGTKITFYRNRDDLLLVFLLWKMTLYFVTTPQAFFQKWVFQNTIQMNGDCSLTAPNAV